MRRRHLELQSDLPKLGEVPLLGYKPAGTEHSAQAGAFGSVAVWLCCFARKYSDTHRLIADLNGKLPGF